MNRDELTTLHNSYNWARVWFSKDWNSWAYACYRCPGVMFQPGLPSWRNAYENILKHCAIHADEPLPHPVDTRQVPRVAPKPGGNTGCGRPKRGMGDVGLPVLQTHSETSVAPHPNTRRETDRWPSLKIPARRE